MNINLDRKTKINYQEFVDNLSSVELYYLQQFAKNRVMEPYEGQAGLEVLQKTNLKLYSGINKIKAWRETRKMNSTLETTPVIKDVPQKSFSILKRIEKMSSNFSNFTKSKFKELEKLFKELTLDFLKKGLELSENEEYEKWIIKNAPLVLKRPIENLEQIRMLDMEDRHLLVKTLYPYRSTRYKTLLSSFDKSVGVILGAVVATNIPGTGLLVSLVSMVKTIIRMSNRIVSLAIMHGYQVQNHSRLFEVCALLLKSVDDWDKNSRHVPLHPDILEGLFEASDKDYEEELADLFEAVGNKELYIAIPGIGMLSLSKINLDNFKLDLSIEHLLRDYFLLQDVRQSDDHELLLKVIEDFTFIYREFKQSGYLALLRKRQHSNQKPSRRKRFTSLIKTVIGGDQDIGFLSNAIILEAVDIFEKTLAYPDNQKQDEIKRILIQLMN